MKEEAFFETVSSGWSQLHKMAFADASYQAQNDSALDWDLLMIDLEELGRVRDQPNWAHALWMHTCTSESPQPVQVLIEMMISAIKRFGKALKQPESSQLILTASANLTARLDQGDEEFKYGNCCTILRALELIVRLNVPWNVSVMKHILHAVKNTMETLHTPILLACLYRWLVQQIDRETEGLNLVNLLDRAQMDTVYTEDGEWALAATNPCALLIHLASHTVISYPWDSLGVKEEGIIKRQAVITFHRERRAHVGPFKILIHDLENNNNYDENNHWVIKHMAEQLTA